MIMEPPMNTEARSQNGTKSSGGRSASLAWMVGGASTAVFAQSGPETGAVSLVPRKRSSAKPTFVRSPLLIWKPVVKACGPLLFSLGIGVAWISCTRGADLGLVALAFTGWSGSDGGFTTGFTKSW
jgi:hypothetical protein